MGNIFHSCNSNRASEIQFDYFTRNYDAIQYPKNLNFPYDYELYSITNKLTKKPYILKRLTFYSDETLQTFLNSLEYILTLKHPNLLEIDRYFVQHNFTNGVFVSYSVNIIMEHFDHTLQEQLVTRQREHHRFSETRLRDIMRQLFDAVGFLHLNKVAHAGICPSNIFITRDHKYKLCFIGEPVFKTEMGLNPNALILLDYMSPRLRATLTSALVSGNFPSKLLHDKFKSDIFSLGLISLQMTSLKEIQSLNVVGSEAKRLELLRECNIRVTPKLVSMIEGMLSEQEFKRPSCADLIGMIQIQQEEASDFEEARKRSKQSFTAQLPTADSTDIQKTNASIEMKKINEQSERKDKSHRKYNISLQSSEDGSRYGNKKSKLGEEDIEYALSYGDCLTGLEGPKSLEASSLSEKFLEIGKLSCDPETPEKDEAGEMQLAIDDLIINDESELLKPISPMIRRLVVRLKGHSQNGDVAQLLADFLSKQKNLQELVLTLPNMSLGEKGIISIVKSLTDAENLRVLFIELRKDKVTSEAIKELGIMLKNKTQLVQLGIDLASNSLTVSMCKELAVALKDLNKIKFFALNVGANQIKNEGLKEITQLLGELKMLENLVLYLYSNEIENREEINMLVNSLNKLENLKTLSLDLSDNLIGDEGAKAIETFLKASSLKQVSLELMNNCMSENTRGRIVKEIVDTGVRLNV